MCLSIERLWSVVSRHRSHAAVLVALIVGVDAFMAARPQTAVDQRPSIEGRVVDSAAQPIPGVSVTAIPATGGVATRTTTGTGGLYQLDRLRDGEYRVDFDLNAFDLARRNHVHVSGTAPARADAILHVSSICECVEIVHRQLRERRGQVADQSGQPLPHAQLEIGAPLRRQVAYADGEGRFHVRVPMDGTWPLTARDSGFAAATQQVSGRQDAAVVFRLTPTSTAALPDTERFSRPCRCPGDLFTHSGR